MNWTGHTSIHFLKIKNGSGDPRRQMPSRHPALDPGASVEADPGALSAHVSVADVEEPLSSRRSACQTQTGKIIPIRSVFFRPPAGLQWARGPDYVALRKAAQAPDSRRRDGMHGSALTYDEGILESRRRRPALKSSDARGNTATCRRQRRPSEKLKSRSRGPTRPAANPGSSCRTRLRRD